MAITVKMMKLVMKMPWNSFASGSVNPDSEPPFSPISHSNDLLQIGLAAVTAHIPRGRDRRGEHAATANWCARRLPGECSVLASDATHAGSRWRSDVAASAERPRRTR